MSNYENAPATILLATACACCGRALVDAESIERGTGPDCAEKYGVCDASTEADWAAAEKLLEGTGITVDSSDSARHAANCLVHAVAKSVRSIDRAVAQRIFSAIAALGFDVLGARIAKRFSLAVLAAGELDAETKKLRAEYASIRAAYCMNNANGVTPAEFNAAVKEHAPSTPAEFVKIAGFVTCFCKACSGTGVFRGRGYEAGGDCFRCSGQGAQSHADVARNRAYDALRGTRRAA